MTELTLYLKVPERDGSAELRNSTNTRTLQLRVSHGGGQQKTCDVTPRDAQKGLISINKCPCLFLSGLCLLH